MALSSELKKSLTEIANTIRALSMDAVQQADSGHPGLPLGCAELGAYLYGHLLKHNPKDSHWLNRDRFILSAGHGSMWLYSCLHLSGFNLSLDQIKKFRQLHSETPGHPESLDTDGVETTTGPLGQGIGNAVGQALGLKLLAQRFNTPEYPLFTSKVYCLAGDGCIMEGVSSEVSSLAGHLGLDNLVLIYDSNDICLDGPLRECCSEDTGKRYAAYGWDVYEIDGNNLDQINEVFENLNAKQKAPTLIIAKTIIGKGAPHKAGTHKVHGSPLGAEEVAATKEALGLDKGFFVIPPSVTKFFEAKQKEDAKREKGWSELLEKWKGSHKDEWKQFDAMHTDYIPKDIEAQLKAVTIKAPISGRKASQVVIQRLAELLPQLLGGSADLSGSDMTMMEKDRIVAPHTFVGRNIKYGVREFGMATMASGLSQTGMFLPYIGTFLTFSDYMRNAIRLASLMKQKVIYQFTHDSIFLGEDGPTHQPVEHYATLRAIPGFRFIRPADSHEVKMAWVAALNHAGPTAFALSRQNLPDLAGADRPYADGVGRGAYIIQKEKSGDPDVIFLSTGSEVSLAIEAAQELEKLGKKVRVVSMPCWELFEEQDVDYRRATLGNPNTLHVVVEAGIEQGWHKYAGVDGLMICMHSFGLSAPAKDLAKEFGFTKESIVQKVMGRLG